MKTYTMIYKDQTLASSFNGAAAAPSQGEVYSTEETVIGTWIDGKPIYRKTFTLTTPTSAGSWGTSAPKIQDIDYVTNIYGVLYRSNGMHQSVPYGESASHVLTCYDVNYGIRTNVSGAEYVNRPFTLTIEYTKTTDEATVELPAIYEEV